MKSLWRLLEIVEVVVMALFFGPGLTLRNRRR